MVWPLSAVLAATMLSLPHTSAEPEQSDPLLTRMLGGAGALRVALAAVGCPPCTMPHSIRIRPERMLSCIMSDGTLIWAQSTPIEVIWALASDG